MTFERERIGRTLREVVLTVGAILGAIAIVVAIGAVAFGLRPLVFRSGSMAPTIGTGDLALARQVGADDLRVGQIVSVPTQGGQRVTHRIVEVEHQAHGVALLRLRGDANTVEDAETYRVTHADKVLFSVPLLGYVVAWLAGSTGRFLLGIYAAFLLMTIFRRPKRGPETERENGEATEAVSPAAVQPATGRGSSGSARIGTAALVAVGLLSVGLAASQATTTLAAWTDDANVTGTTFDAYTVPAPVIASCANTPAGTTTARHITLTWPGVTNPATSYAAVVSDPSGTFSAASITVSGTSTVTADVQYDASTTANRSKTVTVTVTPRLTATATWTGPTDSWKFLTAGNSNQGSCGEKNPPTAAFTAPDTTTRTAAAEQTYVSGSTGCNNNSKPACGTMSDASTITNVDYIFQRVQSGTTQCWSGSAYTSDCTTWRAGTIASQTVWNLTGAKATVYGTPGGSFTIDVRVTDAWGNQTTISRSFTVTP